MNWKQKKVLVVGCGISGVGSSRLLERMGACPILYDENKNLEAEKIREKFQGETTAEIMLGELPKELERTVEMVVFSPGVPVDTEFADSFRRRGIPVIGEIELAFLCARGEVLAITGTNGKTTTTALVGQIMKDYFDSVFVVGNIGNPYTEAALSTKEDSVTVAEISSFQLETIDTFRPRISAILNITPDHLNRHHTMEAYVKVKESITRNQKETDVCVLNYEDPYTKEFGERCPAGVVYFSSARALDDGYFLAGEDMMYAEGGTACKLMNIHEMKLLGIHNVENVLAAIAIARSFGVPMEAVLSTVRMFQAVEHRIEYVTTKSGVDYYNDSKGTNPDAAIKGIQAMNRPTVLIGGGYDKESRYDEWIESFDGKVRFLILLGQTREKIAECARKHGFTDIFMVESLEEAVALSAAKANPGDAVLLSPACASWGMFPNFEVRGRLFKEYVRKLEES